jgi:hypothetical protein
MIKCCIGVAVVAVTVLSEIFVLFVKDIGLKEEKILLNLHHPLRGSKHKELHLKQMV